MGLCKSSWDEESYDAIDIKVILGLIGNVRDHAMAACLSANIPFILISPDRSQRRFCLILMIIAAFILCVGFLSIVSVRFP